MDLENGRQGAAEQIKDAAVIRTEEAHEENVPKLREASPQSPQFDHAR